MTEIHFCAEDCTTCTYYVTEIEQEIPAPLYVLVNDMRREIRNPDTAHLAHGTMSARVRGCTGPLCKKAARDTSRVNRVRRAEARGSTTRRRKQPDEFLEIDPIVELFQKYYETIWNKEESNK